MEALQIRGGLPLHGSVLASGAKNAITKMLVASLLSDKACTFYNVPNISEVDITLGLCREIGMEVQWDRNENKLTTITKKIITSHIPQKFSGANRIPILLIGALLGRSSDEIIVPISGGCKIGKRPIDFHISALEKLGASIEYQITDGEKAYQATVSSKLVGTTIELPYPSVGATENSILAGCSAEGQTIVKNAAIEPEILDFIEFLQKMGASIRVANRTIYIEKMKKTRTVTHRVLTDRMEVACLGMAAIATKGHIFVEGADPSTLTFFLHQLQRIGAGFEIRSGGIEFFFRDTLRGGVHIETDVYPGFATDWQQSFAVLLTQARGHSVIHETVYENRFGYTQILQEMGADLELFTECLGSKSCRFRTDAHYHSLIVRGLTQLHGSTISIPDLRAGFAYIMAALLAPEKSLISNLHYLDRGYENIDRKLSKLGANIKRIKCVQTDSVEPSLLSHIHSL